MPSPPPPASQAPLRRTRCRRRRCRGRSLRTRSSRSWPARPFLGASVGSKFSHAPSLHPSMAGSSAPSGRWPHRIQQIFSAFRCFVQTFRIFPFSPFFLRGRFENKLRKNQTWSDAWLWTFFRKRTLLGNEILIHVFIFVLFSISVFSWLKRKIVLTSRKIMHIR